MSEETFDSPRMSINRVYTRQGDRGETGLAGGQRVPKDSPRIEAYGTVDELNSFLGAVRATVTELAPAEPRLAVLAAILLRVQHELFNLGSILATLPEDVHPAVNDIQAYIASGNNTPALEFLSPIKGPSLEQITVAVGSGLTSATDGAAQYDADVAAQAQQLGLPGW